ncbi:Uncharacterised protein [Mycobacteroides abscessus subsp. abscessus]|nr:Uncharacterised protein [Mycobacteroides abscessus subsp. abscessus]
MHRDGATVRGGEGVNDRQAESGAAAASGARGIRAIEPFEDTLGVRLGHTGSTVDDLEDGVIALGTDPDPHCGSGVTQCVAHQIAEDLT